jgi:CheY-like chemotaxis protein
VLQRKDIFLAMLSHELRNPIAPIRNAAHVLRLQNLSPADTRWAGEIIERQVLQLTRLVDDLLDVARINSGKIHLRMCDVDLRGAIAAAVEETRPNVDSRRHDLRVDLTDGPLMVHGDASRLTQVLANLLSNAAKFTPNGGRIWVTAERREQECFVRVRDSGIGIPAETLPRVFEFFVQADTSVGRPHDGLGIGLALVKTLVEMHGGQVAVTSPGPGKGAEFSLRLPLVAEQPDAQPGVAAISQPVAAGAACRVLVVDDNRDSAESLARLIRQWGHDVCVATCGADGLELARKEPFDVAFMDIGMPQATGYEVARQMRQLPGMDRAVLVAVTGYGQEEDCRQSREAGFDHHWVKPTNVVAVEELLRSRKP